MLTTWLTKLISSRNERLLRKFSSTVAYINQLESEWEVLSAADLRAKTQEFRAELQEGTQLNTLLPKAFATVREASRRVLGMRHFDVQLMGGMALHTGKIAEMRTGEGKTLVATLPAYLNALSGRGVHIVTVNDYLAQRDADWMKPLYAYLGLHVGVIKAGLTTDQRQKAYNADVTYGTNNEFGFDYLRDNMVFDLSEKSQKELHFAIVDEVDSILIDEARTPLIISGPSEESSDLYQQIDRLVSKLTLQKKDPEGGDFVLDEKTKQVYLTEQGHQKLEQLLVQEKLLDKHENLYSSRNIILMHHMYAALRAHYLYHRDVDYINQKDQVTIVDEHTGRLMPGRRWSDGLHQAVEAKEQVTIQSENQTLASITFQNYFRLYEKLSGMTGTADTEAYEFQQIYGLEVVVIPTNQPVQRKDLSDHIYLTLEEKYEAIIRDIQACRERGQPVLVGTASIETSEYLSGLFKKASIPHQVLNAKFHEKEAQIIAEAGQFGAVTIATNMAGRGTDIVLGGSASLPKIISLVKREKLQTEWQARHDQVVEAGGLHIIGSERHESRRIDNQLRGRSGRQGDPGTSRFYLSLQDNLMRIFASAKLAPLMQRLGVSYGEAIEHPWITKAIENAQRKVEGRNFDVRKQLLEFDDVANEQRKVIYQQRNALLGSKDLTALVTNMRAGTLRRVFMRHISKDKPEEEWTVLDLENELNQEVGFSLPIAQWLKETPDIAEEELFDRMVEEASKVYTSRMGLIDTAPGVKLEKLVILQALDELWKEHLATMEYLRQGIHLRSYAQKNPKQEYKQEAFDLFAQLLENLEYRVTYELNRLEIQEVHNLIELEQAKRTPQQLDFQHSHHHVQELEDEAHKIRPAINRNQLCPCGSKKKYKHCHGKLI